MGSNFVAEEDSGDDVPLWYAAKQKHMINHAINLDPGCSYCRDTFRAMLAAVAMDDRGFLNDPVPTGS